MAFIWLPLIVMNKVIIAITVWQHLPCTNSLDPFSQYLISFSFFFFYPLHFILFKKLKCKLKKKITKTKQDKTFKTKCIKRNTHTHTHIHNILINKQQWIKKWNHKILKGPEMLKIAIIFKILKVFFKKPLLPYRHGMQHISRKEEFQDVLLNVSFSG